MKKAEILKIIEKVENKTTIAVVKIKTEGFELEIKKTEPHPQVVRTVKREPTTDNKPITVNKKPNDGKASAFQIKYARDLMTKVFGTDERMSLDFLAHTLEVPMGDVPDIKTWDDTLTVDMASLILDALQPMHSKRRAGSEF